MSNVQTMQNLRELAVAIRELNGALGKVGKLIGRPAQIGHAGEFIAAAIFDIQLMTSAAHRAIDGHFRSGPLAGKSVNVKWYSLNEGSMAMCDGDAVPETYLVLCGPKGSAATSRGKARPWCIETVHLFDTQELHSELCQRSKKIDRYATGIAVALWEKAMVFPRGVNPLLKLGQDQCDMLTLFSCSVPQG